MPSVLKVTARIAPAFDVLTSVPVDTVGLDVESSKALYLSLWYHPHCGGRPYAYVHGSIVQCELCSYKIAAISSEPLGLTLYRSEFRPKKGTGTFIA